MNTKVKQEMKLPDYWRAKFPNGRPTLRALQQQCANGSLPSVKRGSWYVLVDQAENTTGNDLVDLVLN
jgi:hypothetical protein